MEGVGARLGRTSTRYSGPATVFTGPVRKWKKKWVHVSPSSKKHNTSSLANGASASDGSSHLLFFKWAPLSQSGNGNEDGKSESNSPSNEPVTAAPAEEEPPRRRFKYVPIALLEEQNKEVTETEEDIKVDEDASAVEPSEKKAEAEEKPDMNDVPMEDNQEEEKVVRQDLNESTTDLGLNLNANDADVDADSENNPKEAEPLEE